MVVQKRFGVPTQIKTTTQKRFGSIAEEKKPKQVQVYKPPTEVRPEQRITIGKKDFSRQEVEEAYEILNLQLAGQGKGGLRFYGKPNVKAAYKAIVDKGGLGLKREILKGEASRFGVTPLQAEEQRKREKEEGIKPEPRRTIKQKAKEVGLTEEEYRARTANILKRDFKGKLLYDKSGKLIGIESTKYGQTLSIDEYNKRLRAEQEKQARIEYYLPTPTKKISYKDSELKRDIEARREKTIIKDSKVDKKRFGIFPTITAKTTMIEPATKIITDVQELADEGWLGTYSELKDEIKLSPKAEEETLIHELAHAEAPPSLVKDLTEEQYEKIKKEGERALRLKYFDFIGDIGKYTEEDYPKEALAIGRMALRTENLFKIKWAELKMPETIKFLREFRLEEAEKKGLTGKSVLDFDTSISKEGVITFEDSELKKSMKELEPVVKYAIAKKKSIKEYLGEKVEEKKWVKEIFQKAKEGHKEAMAILESGGYDPRTGKPYGIVRPLTEEEKEAMKSFGEKAKEKGKSFITALSMKEYYEERIEPARQQIRLMEEGNQEALDKFLDERTKEEILDTGFKIRSKTLGYGLSAIPSGQLGGSLFIALPDILETQQEFEEKGKLSREEEVKLKAILGETAVGAAVGYGFGRALRGVFSVGGKMLAGTVGAISTEKAGVKLAGSALTIGGRLLQSSYYSYIEKESFRGLKELEYGYTQEGLERFGKVGGQLVGFKLSQYDIPLFKKLPKAYTPTEELATQVKPFTRQRATLILKDPSGKYILGKTKSGELISFGGKIEKGETPKAATLRELFEETGLRAKDLTKLKFEREFTFPEETFFTYTATLKGGAKIRPSSDISKIVRFSPLDLKLQKFFLRISLKTYRPYELEIINYLETGIEPKWFYIQTKQGKYFLGTQSRYDVPAKQQLKYLQEKELLLAHGTQYGELTQRYSSGKELVVSAGKSARGTAKGLFVQPPISTGIPREVIKLEGYTGKGAKILEKDLLSLPFKVGKEPASGYIGLSYLGLGKGGKELGYVIGTGKPTAYIFKQDPSLLIPTSKTLRGIESEFIFPVGTTIKATGRAEKFLIGGKTVFAQPTEAIKDIEVLKNIAKLTKDISKSDKLKILKDIKTKTGIDYSDLAGGYKYIEPKTIASKFGIFMKELSFEKEEKIFKEDIAKVFLKEKIGYKEESTKGFKELDYAYGFKEDYKIPYETEEPYLPEEPPQEYTYKEIYEPELPPPDEPDEPPEEPPTTPPITPTKILGLGYEKRRKQGIIPQQAFNVYVKEPKQKEFSKISNVPLNKQNAADLLAWTLDNTVSRSGYLKPSKQKPKPLGYKIPFGYAEGTSDKFRDFVQRKGKKYAWKGIVERGEFLIDTLGEEQELKAFKALAEIKQPKVSNKMKGVQEMALSL